MVILQVDFKNIRVLLKHLHLCTDNPQITSLFLMQGTRIKAASENSRAEGRDKVIQRKL
jgi:hypothetical protein